MGITGKYSYFINYKPSSQPLDFMYTLKTVYSYFRYTLKNNIKFTHLVTVKDNKVGYVVFCFIHSN